jgi:two-component system chemotaxis response regulator CheY
MKILVVEDEVVSREKMVMIMQSYGECQTASDGTSAIEAFQEAWNNWAPFDLMTLDIGMPDMDGIEILKKIRNIEYEKKMPEDKYVKIIMVTSEGKKEKVWSCIEAGCNDYIVKPFNRETVSKKMERQGFVLPKIKIANSTET